MFGCVGYIPRIFLGLEKKGGFLFYVVSVSVVVSVFSLFRGAGSGMPEMVHGYLVMSVIILKKVSYILRLFKVFFYILPW